jgi:hypothetical protein
MNLEDESHAEVAQAQPPVSSGSSLSSVILKMAFNSLICILPCLLADEALLQVVVHLAAGRNAGIMPTLGCSLINREYA